jgi:hypothetical protein
MSASTDAIDEAIREAEGLRKILRKSKQTQVRSPDDQLLAKSTALGWFDKYREPVAALLGGGALTEADADYRIILESSSRHAARTKYDRTLKGLKTALVLIRSACLAAKPTATTDVAPDFSPLISDPMMQQILVGRWNECLACVTAKAPLSATVMMGGLLEGLLLARVEREKDKKPIFTAKATPLDPKTSAPRRLNEWVLNDYIQVLAELKWITLGASAVGDVLRDYRNYIHPHKQLTQKMHLAPQDAVLFWEISKMITRQVIASVTP